MSAGVARAAKGTPPAAAGAMMNRRTSSVLVRPRARSSRRSRGLTGPARAGSAARC